MEHLLDRAGNASGYIPFVSSAPSSTAKRAVAGVADGVASLRQRIPAFRAESEMVSDGGRGRRTVQSRGSRLFVDIGIAVVIALLIAGLVLFGVFRDAALSGESRVDPLGIETTAPIPANVRIVGEQIGVAPVGAELAPPAGETTPQPAVREAAPTPANAEAAYVEAMTAVRTDAAPATNVDLAVGEIDANPLPGAMIMQTTQAVNMRAGPANGAPTLTVVPGGQDLQVVGCDGWCEVVFEGTRGWIYQSFLR